MTPPIVLKRALAPISTTHLVPQEVSPADTPESGECRQPGTPLIPRWDVTAVTEQGATRLVTVFAPADAAARYKTLERLGPGESIGAVSPALSATDLAVRKPRRSSRRLAVALAGLGVAMTLGACSAAPQGDLAADKKLLASCPAAQLAGDGEIDTSGSVRATGVPEAYAGALKDMVRRTAVCGGHLHVGAFSATAASTVTLYDGDLQMSGSTEQSRLRHVPQAVEDVMKTVNDAYAQKVPSLTPGGTDIVAQYRLSREYLQQLGGTRQLDLLLLTDGYQNAGFVLGDRALTEAEATALAAQADIPQLPGATITVAGIGKASGQDSAPTNVITGMKAFYDALCQRTGATTCVSVTDYTPAGG